jgi:thiol-disulfide isomerase/thioredoxin
MSSSAERSRRTKIALVAVAVLAVGGAAAVKAYDALVAQPRREEQAFQILRVDKPAPDVFLTGADGRPFAISQMKGEVVFVNFWATWCPPCIEEMPSMLALGRALEQSHPGKFRMVAISGDDDWHVVQDYFRSVFGGMPRELMVALDREGRAAQAYYCTARGFCPDIKFPETYIIDKAGRLVAYVVAGRDWSDPAARRFLERLIDS